MGHLQLKLVVFIFTQFPPFKHGSDAQISILFSQYLPLNSRRVQFRTFLS